MRKKPLIETNMYLRDPDNYRRSLITNVSSSTAIETGENILSVVKSLTQGNENKFAVTPSKRKATSQ
jgi:hypothetical protein